MRFIVLRVFEKHSIVILRLPFPSFIVVCDKHLKSKYANILWFIIFTGSIIIPRKISRNKNVSFIQSIINQDQLLRKSDIFYSLKLIWYLFAHFYIIIRELFMSFAMQNPHFLLLCICCVLKLEVIKGENLVNKCTLHTNAFIII